MSQTEDTQQPTDEPEAARPAPDETVEEVHIIDAMKPNAAPTSAENLPPKYGNRKSRAGADAPEVAPISSYSEELEEEEIEMDDLPVRATVAEHLIDERQTSNEPRREDDNRRPRRNERSRDGGNRGRSRERAPRERTPSSPEGAASTTDNDSSPENKESKRPERFGTVESKNRQTRSETEVQEFRPSSDGRTANKGPRKPRERKPRPAPKKKGFFAKIIAFFTGEKEEEKKPQRRNNRDGNRPRGNRGRRGPNNRRGDGEQNSEGGQRRRRRPRKPRTDGDRGERQNREGGGNRRPRRQRRPRRDGGGDARAEGRRAREESEASKRPE